MSETVIEKSVRTAKEADAELAKIKGLRHDNFDQ